MRKYEIMYILRANLDEAGRKEAMDKIATLLTSNGAKVNKVDESLGLRELATLIKDEKKGYYVVLKVEADNAALNEFERIERNDTNVLRYLVVADQE